MRARTVSEPYFACACVITMAWVMMFPRMHAGQANSADWGSVWAPGGFSEDMVRLETRGPAIWACL